MKLRTKFSLIFCLIIIGVIASVSTILFFYEKQMLVQQVRDKQKALIRSLEQIIKEALALEDDLLLVNYMDILERTNESIVYSVFIGENNRIRTNKDIDLLITNDCSDDVAQILIKAGLRHIVSEKQKDGNCLFTSEKMESLFLSEFINQSMNVVRAFSNT